MENEMSFVERASLFHNRVTDTIRQDNNAIDVVFKTLLTRQAFAIKFKARPLNTLTPVVATNFFRRVAYSHV